MFLCIGWRRMGPTVIMKELILAIAICCIYVFRPMSCRRTVSIAKDYLETSDRKIMLNCYRKCLMLKSRILSESKVRKLYMEGCFRGCVNRQMEKEAILGMAPSKNYVVLGQNDKPPESFIVPSRIPHLPKELYKVVGTRRWEHGDCDAFGLQKNIDVNMKTAVLLDHVAVTCIDKNQLLVSWEQPKGLDNCTGYQVNYRLGGYGESGGIYCYDVNKEKTALMINKDKGFHGQREIHLAVTALPLPFKCDIKLQKFELCRDEEPERARRDTSPTASFVILEEGDPIPTDLVMPSELPTLPPDQFQRYKINSNCHQPMIIGNPKLYAGRAKGLRVACRQAGNFTKKAFVIHWDQPKDYLSVKYTHFQVIYSITPGNVIPKPERLGCHEVEKNTLSYALENVEDTDNLDVVVLAYPNHGQLVERMEKFHPCLPAKSPTTPQKPATARPIRVEVAVGVSIAIMVALAILALLFIYHRRRTHETPVPADLAKIYVSYYPDTKKYHSSLLNLVAKLRRLYSVNLIMDSYCETEVTELGLPRWCQMQLSESTRVLMVISKDYLKICKKWQSGSTDLQERDDTNVNRVCSELQYITNHMFERRKNSLLTIMLADVSQKDLPDPFRGMKALKWPKNEDDEDALVCNMYAEESVVAL